MRLVRHLTFSNVIALIALFIALGGAAYAGSKINGKTIVNKSIGGGKLKNETITANKIKKGTITSAQIAPGSIDSTQINVNSLTTVPSAQTATTAQTATSATTAQTATSATTAQTATSADEATTATSADNAKHAEEADNAKHANEADSASHANEADTATTASNATHATSADEADSLEGTTAAELTLSCGTGTEFYGGMCWDETNRQPKLWIVALKTCADANGRLPTISELIAFVLFDQTNEFAAEVWSGDLADVVGPAEEVLTSDETSRNKHEAAGGGTLGYRCVFPQTN